MQQLHFDLNLVLIPPAEFWTDLAWNLLDSELRQLYLLAFYSGNYSW